MHKFILPIVATLMLSGCYTTVYSPSPVVTYVEPAPVYVAPSVVVVRPYYGHYHYGHYRYHRHYYSR